MKVARFGPQNAAGEFPIICPNCRRERGYLARWSDGHVVSSLTPGQPHYRVVDAETDGVPAYGLRSRARFGHGKWRGYPDNVADFTARSSIQDDPFDTWCLSPSCKSRMRVDSRYVSR